MSISGRFKPSSSKHARPVPMSLELAPQSRPKNLSDRLKQMGFHGWDAQPTMWKPEHRRAGDRHNLRYPSDLTDAGWALFWCRWSGPTWRAALPPKILACPGYEARPVPFCCAEVSDIPMRKVNAVRHTTGPRSTNVN